MNVNEVIKALQFAAKVHEIFMVASLTAIVSQPYPELPVWETRSASRIAFCTIQG